MNMVPMVIYQHKLGFLHDVPNLNVQLYVEQEWNIAVSKNLRKYIFPKILTGITVKINDCRPVKLNRTLIFKPFFKREFN